MGAVVTDKAAAETSEIGRQADHDAIYSDLRLIGRRYAKLIQDAQRERERIVETIKAGAKARTPDQRMSDALSEVIPPHLRRVELGTSMMGVRRMGDKAPLVVVRKHRN